MSRGLRIILAAFAAAAVETGVLWALSRVGQLDLALDIAVAFAAGYFTLLAAFHVLGPAVGTRPPPLQRQLRAYASLGMAGMLLAVVVLYLGVSLLSLSLTLTNAAALAVVGLWIALGWPYASEGKANLAAGIHQEPEKDDSADS